MDPNDRRKDKLLSVTVTRSAGDDRAVLVFIDTEFEPDGSDDGPGLRVLINDNEAYVGKAYDLGAHHQAESAYLRVTEDAIRYTGEALCFTEHGDWTGPHQRIGSCP